MAFIRFHLVFVLRDLCLNFDLQQGQFISVVLINLEQCAQNLYPLEYISILRPGFDKLPQSPTQYTMNYLNLLV